MPQKFTSIQIHPSKFIKIIYFKFSSATPIKLFTGVPNLISPFKVGQDIYNNSPIKMEVDFGSPFGGKFLIFYLYFNTIRNSFTS